MMLLVLIVGAHVVAINLLAFALFGIDKRRATEGAWRIRESTLIWAALAGGWPGAKAGQSRFRHKSRKQPFAGRLNAVGRVQLGALVALALASLSPSVDVAAATMRLAEAASSALTRLVPRTLPGDAAPTERRMPRRFGPGSGDGM